MENFESEITYQLNKPFSYASDGEMKEASFLVIKAPTNSISKQVNIIEAALNYARKEIIKEASNNDSERKDKKSEDIDPKVMFSFMKMYMDENVSDRVNEAFKNILTHGEKETAICLVDANEKLTTELYRKITYKDTQNMLAEYIVNFIDSFQNV